jgi:hypothetical protein
MHSKIIQPGKHGKAIYDNKGSCRALVDYLGHECRDNKTSLAFFNSTQRDITPMEVKTAIDGNIKGVRKGQVKFYSLVISPSPDELKHLAEDRKSKTVSANSQSNQQPQSPDRQYVRKLELFTKQVMENYAANFHLACGKKLSSADLTWYATIHYHRQYKGVDQKVKEGEVKKGTLKPGANAHVHILVSKRDSKQQITLNPQSSTERFPIKRWQKENETSFDKLFTYQRVVNQETEKPIGLTVEQQERFHHRIGSKLSIINQMLLPPDQLSQKEVEQIAQKKAYSQTFFYNLNRLEQNLRKGQPVSDPLHLLEHNRDKKLERLEGGRRTEYTGKKHTLGNQIDQTFKVLADVKMLPDNDLSMPDIRRGFRRRTHEAAPEQKAVKRGI